MRSNETRTKGYGTHAKMKGDVALLTAKDSRHNVYKGMVPSGESEMGSAEEILTVASTWRLATHDRSHYQRLRISPKQGLLLMDKTTCGTLPILAKSEHYWVMQTLSTPGKQAQIRLVWRAPAHETSIQETDVETIEQPSGD